MGEQRIEKKLLGSLGNMKEAVFAMEAAPRPKTEESGRHCISAIERALSNSVALAGGIFGTYTSYSMSSSSDALKVEPYMILPSDESGYVEVVHNSAYGTTHHGFALMNGLNHVYIIFNENRPPQLALFNICLKIPMYDRPPYLRGLYTCFDYNHNPIARRILFVKSSDSVSREEFMTMKGCLKQHVELDDTEKQYYDYTCSEDDALRMRDIPTPQMTVDDLAAEKELLKAGRSK